MYFLFFFLRIFYVKIIDSRGEWYTRERKMKSLIYLITLTYFCYHFVFQKTLLLMKPSFQTGVPNMCLFRFYARKNYVALSNGIAPEVLEHDFKSIYFKNRISECRFA